jgi:hypothetical protein
MEESKGGKKGIWWQGLRRVGGGRNRKYIDWD